MADGFALTDDDGFELVDEAEGRVVDDGCAPACCTGCRTYFRLDACVTSPDGPCGVGTTVPSIYLWSGTRCMNSDPLEPGTVVFVNGRCWVIAPGLYNDRAAQPPCPEPRVPEGAQVFDQGIVMCLPQGCSTPLCVAAAGAFVEIRPCGPVVGTAKVHYTCRSFLPRCFVMPVLADPSDSDSTACYNFDPDGPNLQGPPPLDGVFYTELQIQSMLNVEPPPARTCCHCEFGVVIQEPDRKCEWGKTDPGQGGTGNECCCGTVEAWADATVTISRYIEEYESGNTLVRVSLEAPFSYRNGDALLSTIFVPLTQRTFVAGVEVDVQQVQVAAPWQPCGRVYMSVLPNPPTAGPGDSDVQRQGCTTYTRDASFGPPGSQIRAGVTVSVTQPRLDPPCVGGCGGRLGGAAGKGGIAGLTNTGGGTIAADGGTGGRPDDLPLWGG